MPVPDSAFFWRAGGVFILRVADISLTLGYVGATIANTIHCHENRYFPATVTTAVADFVLSAVLVATK